MKKKILAFVSLICSLLLIVSCSGDGGETGSVKKRVLRFAHNHTETNPSHIALLKFADILKEKTNGELEIQFFPNSILGDDRTVVEQVQAGSIDFTRVSASTLENFNPEFSVLLLPYLFRNDDQFHKVLSSPAVEKMYNNLTNSGMLGLTYQDAGERSFYTKDSPIYTPQDLEGKKIRVINSQSSIELMENLGAIPTPIPYGEIYTALQQGVIDGAENNAQALTLDKHGEVAKYYSLNGHTRLSDFVVISYNTWQSLTDEQRQIVKDALIESTDYHNDLWGEATTDALNQAKNEMGIEVIEVDKAPFEELTKPMYNRTKADPKLGLILDEILVVRDSE